MVHRKKLWSAPTLVAYGDVRALTRGKDLGGNDGYYAQNGEGLHSCDC